MVRANALSYGGKGSDASLAYLFGQRQRVQLSVDLEWQGLIVPIQEMQIVVDAGIGMLGSVVVAPSSFRISVDDHSSKNQPVPVEYYRHARKGARKTVDRAASFNADASDALAHERVASRRRLAKPQLRRLAEGAVDV